jgi:tripartite-type tricarboxylate transporter receptor subunit TctC
MESSPDGYTLLAAPSAVFTILPAQKSLPFDINIEFVPLGLFQSEPMIIAVSARLGVESLSELITRAKSEPNKLVLGTNQAGSLPNLAAKLLVARTGAPLTIVPYARGGSTEAIREIMGGRGHVTIDGKSSLYGAIESGDLKPLAVMSRGRSSALPGVPAAAEIDEHLTAVGWVGLFALRGTPEAIVSKITSDLRAANDDPEIRKRVAQIGSPFRALYGKDLAKFIIEDQRLWFPLTKPSAHRPSKPRP